MPVRTNEPAGIALPVGLEESNRLLKQFGRERIILMNALVSIASRAKQRKLFGWRQLPFVLRCGLGLA